MSSSWPGPSPTNTSSALGLPTPKTMLVRALCSLQRVQSPMSARMRSSESFSMRSSKSDGPAGPWMTGISLDGTAADSGDDGERRGAAAENCGDAVADAAGAESAGAAASADGNNDENDFDAVRSR